MVMTESKRSPQLLLPIKMWSLFRLAGNCPHFCNKFASTVYYTQNKFLEESKNLRVKKTVRPVVLLGHN